MRTLGMRIVTYLIEYLGEFEVIFETILHYIWIRGPDGLFWCKKPPSKVSCLGTFKWWRGGNQFAGRFSTVLQWFRWASNEDVRWWCIGDELRWCFLKMVTMNTGRTGWTFSTDQLAVRPCHGTRAGTGGAAAAPTTDKCPERLSRGLGEGQKNIKNIKIKIKYKKLLF